ncbi:MAG: collagen-like protein [Candidatus Dadabacteria bacterium]|nr:MAG: collagen-like protein [Candidatus Dadabacteria bacterium]
MSRTLLLILVTTVLTLTCLPESAYAGRKNRLCEKDGTLIIKRRCKASRGETELDVPTFSGLVASTVGSIGPQGPKGDPGPQGPQGPAGMPGLEVKGTSTSAPLTVAAGTTITVTPPACSPGKVAIGGECYAGGSSLTLTTSYSGTRDKTRFGNTWLCTWKNNSGGEVTVDFTAKVFCVDQN